jgi:hypothetical protein
VNDPQQLDLSTYDWAGAFGKLNPTEKIKTPACGWCHPGGGPMEYGRKKDGTPDYSMNLITAEQKNTKSLDGDFSSDITPDKRSHFNESGVLEADCMICHGTNYQFGPRANQINMKNYRWAATAGADLGKINGAIFTFKDPMAKPGTADFMAGTWNLSESPVVSYSWDDKNKFTDKGQLKGTLISNNVETKSCLQCHSGPDTKKVGWKHLPEFDVHFKAGFRCTDCHSLVGETKKERMQHQIAKGWHPLGTVRDDLDGVGMKTCAWCHLEGKYKPTRAGMPEKVKNPTAKHLEKFPDVEFHFDSISCASCHSTEQPAMSGYLLDMATGGQIWYTAATLETISWPDDFAVLAPQPWKPWIAQYDAGNDVGEQFIPVSPKIAQWFGEKMKNGEIRPIILRYVNKAFQTIEKPTVVTVNMVGGTTIKKPTVATEGDIKSMITALTAMGFKDVVFVSDRIYELKEDTVTVYEDKSTAHPHNFPIHHNVVSLAKKQTYGWRGSPEGCLDCHSKKSEFFTKMLINNPGRFLLEDYPVPNEPNAKPQMYQWGMDEVPLLDE